MCRRRRRKRGWKRRKKGRRRRRRRRKRRRRRRKGRSAGGLRGSAHALCACHSEGKEQHWRGSDSLLRSSRLKHQAEVIQPGLPGLLSSPVLFFKGDITIFLSYLKNGFIKLKIMMSRECRVPCKLVTTTLEVWAPKRA